MSNPPTITILGSGFAALTAVRALRKRDANVTIRVIAPKAEFVYLPSLIWVPTGLRKGSELVVPLERFFAAQKVEFVPGRVTALTARELAAKLELGNSESLRPWLDRLCEWGLVGQSGRTQATRYFVQPDLLRSLEFPAATTLKRIEDHRLRALVLEDLGRYSWSSIGEIHGRIGEEIPRRRLRTMLQLMCEQTAIQKAGELKARRYALPNAVLLTKPRSN